MKTNKKFFAALAAVLVLLTLLPSAVFAAEFPKHQNYIADEAGILTEDVISEIRDINRGLQGDLGLTIAVCTVNTIGERDIADYARDLFEEWKLGEGVLILVAKEDNNYFFVPSIGFEDILTNEVLAGIRDTQFEEDFSKGFYERAIRKTAIKLKNTLLAGVQEREAAAAALAAEEAAAAGDSDAEKGTTAGSVIVGIFKTLLWIVLIAVVLFAALFVWAMFNEDVAAILRKLIFKRGSSGRPKVPQNYYDDRLYGNRPMNPQQRPANARRRPNPNAPNGNGGYYGAQNYPPQNGYAQPMPQNYGANGAYPGQGQLPYGGSQTMNPNYTPAPNSYPQQQGYPQQNGYPQQQYPQQNAYPQQQGYPQQNAYPQQQGYPQQNAYPQQGYPQQNAYPQQQGVPQNRYNPNYRPRQNNAAQQTTSDATVQFNIPGRG